MSSPFSPPDRPPHGVPREPQYPPAPFPGYVQAGRQPSYPGYSNPADRPRPSTPLPLLLVSAVFVVTGFVVLVSVIVAGTTNSSNMPSSGGALSVVLGVIAMAIGGALVLYPGNTVKIIATVWAGLWCLSIVGVVVSVPVILVLWRSRATTDHFEFCDAQRSATKLR
ncbi:hypothetical protein [Gordonia hydrophobica]|uniref:Transmembrane protein n=1 Tax=Gordonia hydrophobica TaxID=40516 RepID=A0ABZ2U0R1_9ACTN|nr:hypothetical protein [Gordonia hydrophobica]MBM7367631.1 hypothetical protein [Gordonia hydrophobica]